MFNSSTAVLVVDDVETMRRILKSLLKQIGIDNVECVGDPLQALQRLEEQAFDLVITDWHMESMTGLGLLHLMTAKPRLRGIPVILMSSEVKAQNVIDAKAAGARGYLIKPFTADALRARVREALGLV